MPWYICLWTEETIDHVAQHGITPDEFESVVMKPARTGLTRKTGRHFAEGQLEDGRWIFCVYEQIDETYLEPVTAFEVER